VGRGLVDGKHGTVLVLYAIVQAVPYKLKSLEVQALFVEKKRNV
jgi:hypothetical protein